MWRARKLVENMTLDEKISFLHGEKGPYVGNVAPLHRLGIPPINMNDGPQGFRAEKHKGTSTAWPSGLNMAASWDPEAVHEWGSGMGREFYDKGSNVQLGPGVCLARVPWNGRNFEYLSGEDPYLGYVLAQSAVKGIQSQKVVANAKHWVMNNQETNRQAVSEDVDERTRFEMYYPPFEGAIEAGVGSFMCSYNKVNGAWSCENPTTLAQDLKRTLGFQGYVMSDWGATHSASIMQGLDMEQATQTYMNGQVLKLALDAGNVSQAAIDDSVARILWSMLSTGVMDEPLSTWDRKNIKRNVTSEASRSSARRLAAASTVLLKNAGGVLPLRTDSRIAVIGLGDANAVTHSFGSGRVDPSRVVTPLAGIRAAVAPSSAVTFRSGNDTESAASAARAADYAIVFVGTLSGEGQDRSSLSFDTGMPSLLNQNELVRAVAAANSKTIVVASAPGAVLMPWSNSVAAVLLNFMPGQEVGSAVADVLFGRVNPSAKLPLTLPNSENETRFSPDQWPGGPDPARPAHASYSEKLLVGYRYYDAHGLNFSTGFPFGHGLSYSTFEYSNLSIDDGGAPGLAARVAFTVENSGRAAGAEVAQLYLGFPSGAGEPPRQLRGFEKTRVLQPGERQRVALPLRPRDLSVWDEAAHAWSLARGTFQVVVGASSRDARLNGVLSVVGESGQPPVAYV